jgi:hypothetical protein
MAFITKTIFIVLITLFYSTIFVFMGFAFTPLDSNNTTFADSSGNTYHTSGTCSQSWCFTNVILNISNIPFWINAIIFTPLIAGLTFVIISLIPGMDGGA